MKTKYFVPLVIVLCTILLCSSCGNTPALSPFGTWTLSSMTLRGITLTDLSITFNVDGTYSATYWVSGSQWSSAGTFSPATMPSDTVLRFITTSSSGGAYADPVGTVGQSKYSNLTELTMDYYEGVGNDFVGPFKLTRKKTP